MQFELLLYRLGQVPAKKKQGVLAVAFGVKKPPGVGRYGRQNKMDKEDSGLGALADGFSIVSVHVYFIRLLSVGRLHDKPMPFDGYFDLF